MVDFSVRTFANMNVALERVCGSTVYGERHEVRKRVALQILRSARSGKITLRELTDAGRDALTHLPKRYRSWIS